MDKENIAKIIKEMPWTPGNDGTMHGVLGGHPDPCGPKGKSIEEIRIYPGDEETAIIYILRAANLLRGYPRQEANVKALRECFANIIAEAR